VKDIEALDDPFSPSDDNFIYGDSIGNYVVEFASNACNYYERGRSKIPLTLLKIQASGHDMLWLPKSCWYLFLYKIPMCRKRVRLKSHFLNVLWCALML
jgi:hypothetical protein